MIEEKIEIGGRELTIESGKIAKQASGSCIVRYGETVIFVAVTARIIHKNILGKNDDFKKDISELEKMIQNVGLFRKILKASDKVVTKFLEDSKVEEKIDEANTAHNFFSNQVYGKSMLEVIDSKIRQEQEEIDYIKKTVSGI